MIIAYICSKFKHMASTRFFIRKSGDECSIYIRFTIDKSNRYERKTGYTVNSSGWSQKKGKSKGKDEDQKKLDANLIKLGSFIQTACNDALSAKERIDGNWLEYQIGSFHGTTKESTDELVEWISKYIDFLPYKTKKGTDKVGVEKTTIQKYKNLKNKVESFEEFSKRKYLVKDVNDDFQENFIKYLRDELSLSLNTVGRWLKFIKTICLYAKRKGVEVNPDLETITGFTTEPFRVVLTPIELAQISRTDYDSDAYDNARDWLILGCHLGQRVSDLLTLTRSNFEDYKDYRLITLVQKKTKKQVAIPINEEVDAILSKHNGNFPRKISSAKFNQYIKQVAKLAGIEKEIKGAKIDPDTSRKVEGIFPKWELITSHVCRRSFATNYYNEIPTSLLISVTGHATEKQFLEYVGKPPVDQAIQLARLFSEISYIRKTKGVGFNYKKAE